MAAINFIDPSIIKKSQLLSELKEIRNLLKLCLNNPDLKIIPNKYKQNYDFSFFINKLKFIHKRYKLIIKEFEIRNIKYSPFENLFNKINKNLYNDFIPTKYNTEQNVLKFMSKNLFVGAKRLNF